MKKVLAVCGLVTLAEAASAQITNTTAWVDSVVVSGISSVYEDAIGVAVAATAIGMAVFFVRKGLKARG